MSVQIVTWNGNSFLSKQDRIRMYLSERSPPSIFAFLESKLPHDHPPIEMKGYHTYSFPYRDQSSGIIIFIHQSLNSAIRHDLSTDTKTATHPSSIQTIEIQIRRGIFRRHVKTLISFVYIHP